MASRPMGGRYSCYCEHSLGRTRGAVGPSSGASIWTAFSDVYWHRDLHFFAAREKTLRTRNLQRKREEKWIHDYGTFDG